MFVWGEVCPVPPQKCVLCLKERYESEKNFWDDVGREALMDG